MRPDTPSTHHATQKLETVVIAALAHGAVPRLSAAVTRRRAW